MVKVESAFFFPIRRRAIGSLRLFPFFFDMFLQFKAQAEVRLWVEIHMNCL